eukprot:CAMPEP_0177737528 /NCGR_PEP_ID=MMETSP0484_2-20121128/25934_1 /TAXON_ID=354590 /ORGANISM="Rhodomonas lens, Strain RHODO" /LENGTH=105 /DNA_ID=CAMNT_0019251317 /DNA_START=78 /DNA_END=396 /DNA_ORIENTATION=+
MRPRRQLETTAASPPGPGAQCPPECQCPPHAGHDQAQAQAEAARGLLKDQLRHLSATERGGFDALDIVSLLLPVQRLEEREGDDEGARNADEGHCEVKDLAYEEL